MCELTTMIKFVIVICASPCLSGRGKNTEVVFRGIHSFQAQICCPEREVKTPRLQMANKRLLINYAQRSLIGSHILVKDNCPMIVCVHVAPRTYFANTNVSVHVSTTFLVFGIQALELIA